MEISEYEAMLHKTPPFFELRSSNVDALLFIVKTTHIDALRDELARRFDATPEFFSNEIVVIDIRCVDDVKHMSIRAIADLLKQQRMHPIGVVASDTQRQWIEQAGLPLVEVCAGREVKPTNAAATHTTSAAQPISMSRAASASTMIFDKPLRSGQQIYAHGDLVVLGPVNYGAEVMAVGNLYIYAPLRGRALAGIHGNQDARIFCTCLEAELISIAGIYQTAETPLLANVRSRSMQVRLVEEQLVMEPLQLT